VSDDTARNVLSGQIRAVLCLVAGAIAQHGWVNNATSLELLAIATAIIPIAWSAWDHVRAGRKAKADQATALNVGIVVADRVSGATPLVPAEDAQKVIAIVAPSLPDALPNPLAGH
jgi:hypothetical protein